MAVLHLVAAVIAAYVSLRLFKFHLQRRKIVEAIDKIPGPNPRVPILATIKNVLLYELSLANGKQFGSQVLLWQDMLAMCKAYSNEGIFKYWLGLQPIVHLFSPELIEPLMTSQSVINKSPFYHVFKPWIGEGLVTSGAEKWRVRRRIITPAFHFRILADFLPVMDTAATRLVRRLNGKRRAVSNWFEVSRDISQCTMEVICETAMGISIDFDSEEGANYMRAVHTVTKLGLERIMLPWLHWDAIYFRTAAGRKFRRACDFMHAFSMRVITERRREWQRVLSARRRSGLEDATPDSFKGERQRLAFLDLMVRHQLREKDVSLEDVREEVETFMFAGQDTTANTLSWAVYFLGLWPDIQRRCRLELDEVLGPVESEASQGEDCLNARIDTSQIGSEHLARMRYIEMVLKETLRMMPTVPILGRSVSEDIRISDAYVVPKGAAITIVTEALHNDPKHYPKPERFIPERFSAENSLARHPYAYIPFSAGPRNCIGQRFAMMEMKCILAKLLRNFEIESAHELDKLRIVGEMVLKSDAPLQVRLTPLAPE